LSFGIGSGRLERFSLYRKLNRTIESPREPSARVTATMALSAMLPPAPCAQTNTVDTSPLGAGSYIALVVSSPTGMVQLVFVILSHQAKDLHRPERELRREDEDPSLRSG